MSARQWKPGDVALVECSDGEWRQATCERHGSCADLLVWRFPDRVYRHVSNGPARPLVIIDPEDHEQVRRINDAQNREYIRRGVPVAADEDVEVLQAALRSLIADPKPDEPLGLGAVVVDANGTRWIRTGDCSLDWVTEFNTETHPWSKIAAVRVLSEGVVTDA